MVALVVQQSPCTPWSPLVFERVQTVWEGSLSMLVARRSLKWDRRDTAALPRLQNDWTIVGQWSLRNEYVLLQSSDVSASPVSPLCHLCSTNSVHWTMTVTGSTIYSEGSFVRSFFSPKLFQVIMLRRTCGPKVHYSEVHLVRRLLFSEDSIFRKALHYMDSMLRSFCSPKFT